MVFEKIRKAYAKITKKLKAGEITIEQSKEQRKPLDKKLKELNTGLTNLIRAVKAERTLKLQSKKTLSF